MIIAKNGDSFLVIEQEGADRGRVFNQRTQVLYREKSLPSILKWTGWEEYNLGEEDEKELLRGATSEK